MTDPSNDPFQPLFKKLSTMLKGRHNKSFKKDLRQQLLQRAEQLNGASAPKQRLKWTEAFDWSQFFGKRLVPATAGLLVVVMAFTLINPGGNGVIPEQLVDTVAAKDYYTLTPTEQDEVGGVNTETSFVLASEGDLNLDDIESSLLVTPSIDVSFSQPDNHQILITPAEPLDPDTVYSFKLAAQNIDDSPFKKEFSWAYQISDNFTVRSTSPGDQKSGVPINSSIEITFNSYGVTADDLENHLTIEPALDTTIEVNGKTAVIYPADDTLAETSLYTVTVSGDLPLDGTSKTLGDDHVFQFETTRDTYDTDSLHFRERIYNLSPDETAAIEVSFYERNYGDFYTTVDENGNPVAPENAPLADVNIYRYGQSDDFYQALQTYETLYPNWTYYTESTSTERLPTSGLTPVYSLTDWPIQLSEEDHRDWIVLDDNLPMGQYLITMERNGNYNQAFLQVSPTATYIELSKKESLVWVNSTETGEPLNDVTVSIPQHDISDQTDADGMVTFDELLTQLELAENDHDEVYVAVDDGTMEHYYRLRFYNSSSSSDQLFWNYVETDRSTYQPTDTVQFWGYLEGRDHAITGNLTAYLVNGYASYYANTETFADDNFVLDQQSFAYQPGQAFQGEFSFTNLTPGRTYSVVLFANDQMAGSQNFYVTHYTKPAYEISLSPENENIFLGEPLKLDMQTQFFEGTPVADTQLTFKTGYSSKGYSEIVTTDAQGDAHVEYIPSESYCQDDDNYCGPYTYFRTSVYPTNEELADISADQTFYIYRVKTLIESDSLDAEIDNIELTLRDVDLNAEDVMGDLAAGNTVELTIEKIDYTKTANGNYYDPIDKVVRTSYKYEKVETVIDTQSLTSDSNGQVQYNPNLDEDGYYNIRLKVYDDDGHFYEEGQNIGTYYYPSFDDKFLRLEVEGKETGQSSIWFSTSYDFDFGETGTLRLYENQTQSDLPSDGSARYLFIDNQGGIRDYDITHSPRQNITFSEDMMPNINMSGVMFDGTSYRESYSIYVEYDQELERLDLDISADQDEYAPGDEVTLNVTATTPNGSPASDTNVLLNLVDEAYFALFDESFSDPLEILYNTMPTGTTASYASHEFEGDVGGGGGCFIAGTQILMADGTTKAIEDITVGDTILTKSDAMNGELVEANVLNTHEVLGDGYLLINGHLGVTTEHIIFLNNQWQRADDIRLGDQLLSDDGDWITVTSIDPIKRTAPVYNFEVETYHTYFADGIYVHNQKGGMREDFQDTALFELIQTDSNGQAKLTFTLPDNITQWRVTGAAIRQGDQLQAGMNNTAINVTKDLFVLPVINQEYLSGDQPIIPLRAFGDALTSETPIAFGLEIESLEFSAETTGVAYQNAYIKLPELPAGDHRIVTSASSNNLNDAMALTPEVRDSHIMLYQDWDSLLSENTALVGSSTQYTDVLFVNEDVYSLMLPLRQLQRDSGHRMDQYLGNHLANIWLAEFFDQDTIQGDFPATLFQSTTDGGIALLPYSDPELRLSALAANVDTTLWDESTLHGYFNTLWTEKQTASEKVLTLYGLSAFGDPHLNDLDYLTATYELSIEDKLFAALAYLNYGDDTKASELFVDLYQNNTARDGANRPYLTHDDATTDQTLSWTTLMAMVAQGIGSDQRDDFWAHVLSEDNSYDEDRTELITLEKLLYIQDRLIQGVSDRASFKWNGDTILLEDFGIHFRSLSPEDRQAATFSDVRGNVYVMTRYAEAADLDELDTDPALSISRQYFVNGVETATFEPGDLVEVRFNINIPETKEYQGRYRLTDYLPSGLQTLSQSTLSETYVNSQTDYRRPYHVDRQQLQFYIYCNPESSYSRCNDKRISYLARVINGGTFITEPATLQSYQYADRVAVSGEHGSIHIEVEGLKVE